MLVASEIVPEAALLGPAGARAGITSDCCYGPGSGRHQWNMLQRKKVLDNRRPELACS